MPGEVSTRVTLPPSAFIMYTCEPPSLVSVTASLRPSGDHAGDELLPRKLATARLSPVSSDCTYTTGFLFSKDTYASRVPSGDQRGDSSGSFDATTDCGSLP